MNNNGNGNQKKESQRKIRIIRLVEVAALLDISVRGTPNHRIVLGKKHGDFDIHETPISRNAGNFLAVIF